MALQYLFLVYAMFLIGMRIYLTYWHQHAPKIGNFQMHHYMYGVVLTASYFVFRSPELLAVGLALIVDELPLFFIYKTWDWPDDHWAEYHSWKSVLSVVVISVTGYFAFMLL